MSFEKIGPYGYNRSDQIAASLVISFLIGARALRIKMTLFALTLVILAVVSSLTGDFSVTCAALVLAVLAFIVGPAFRSLKNNRNITLSFDIEGLIAETNNIRTTYKWATIQSYRKIGSRLFIMVTDGCALIVADRFISPENMARLIATLDSHRASV